MFDYNSAVSEGYSDDEILDYLKGSRSDFDFDAAVSEGYSVPEIAQHVSTMPIKQPEPTATITQSAQIVTPRNAAFPRRAVGGAVEEFSPEEFPPTQIKPAEFTPTTPAKAFVQDIYRTGAGIAKGVGYELQGEGKKFPTYEELDVEQKAMYDAGKAIVDSGLEPQNSTERMYKQYYENLAITKPQAQEIAGGIRSKILRPAGEALVKGGEIFQGEPTPESERTQHEIEDAREWLKHKDALNPKNFGKTVTAAATIAAESGATNIISAVPVAGVAVPGLVEKSGWIDEAKQAGLDDPALLNSYGDAYGLLSGGIERVGGEILFAPVKGLMGKKAMGKAFKAAVGKEATKKIYGKVLKTIAGELGDVGLGALSEGTEEFSQAMISDAIKYAAFTQAAIKNPEKREFYLQQRDKIQLKDSVKGALEQAYFGAIAGGAIRGVTGAAAKAVEAATGGQGAIEQPTNLPTPPRPEVPSKRPISEVEADFKAMQYPKEVKGAERTRTGAPQAGGEKRIEGEEGGRIRVRDDEEGRLGAEKEEVIETAEPFSEEKIKGMVDRITAAKTAQERQKILEGITGEEAKEVLRRSQGIPKAETTGISPEEAEQISAYAKEGKPLGGRKFKEGALPQAEEKERFLLLDMNKDLEIIGPDIEKAVEGVKFQGVTPGVSAPGKKTVYPKMTFRDNYSGSNFEITKEGGANELREKIEKARNDSPEATAKAIAAQVGNLEYIGKTQAIGETTGTGKYTTETNYKFKTKKGIEVTIKPGDTPDRIKSYLERKGLPKKETTVEPTPIKPETKPEKKPEVEFPQSQPFKKLSTRALDTVLNRYIKKGMVEGNISTELHGNVTDVLDRLTTQQIASASGVDEADVTAAVSDIKDKKISDNASKIRQSIAPRLLYGKSADEVVDEITETGETKKEVEAVERPEEEKKEITNIELQPSEAQKEAGNYQKGHVDKFGFDVSIENPKGSIRSGTDKQGKKWSQKINYDYGYIRGTKGADAFRTKDGTDQLDVFINPGSEQGDRVYVVNQVDPKTGKFDEHKIMMGFDTIGQARVGYLSNYEKGWKGLGSIHEMSMERFKEWAYSDETKKEYSPTKEEGAQKTEQKKEEPAETKKGPITDESLNAIGKELESKIENVTFQGVQEGYRGKARTTPPTMAFRDNVTGSNLNITKEQGIEGLKKRLFEMRALKYPDISFLKRETGGTGLKGKSAYKDYVLRRYMNEGITEGKEGKKLHKKVIETLDKIGAKRISEITGDKAEDIENAFKDIKSGKSTIFVQELRRTFAPNLMFGFTVDDVVKSYTEKETKFELGEEIKQDDRFNVIRYAKTGTVKGRPAQKLHEQLIDILGNTEILDISNRAGINPKDVDQAISDIKAGKETDDTKKVRQAFISDLIYKRGNVMYSKRAIDIKERQPADVFFSPLLKAVQNLKQEKGTGEQFFNMLTKTPGVKEAEWKWLGLDDFLKGKKSVTRQEIEDFIRENQVRVQEVEKSTLESVSENIAPSEITRLAIDLAADRGDDWRELGPNGRQQYENDARRHMEKVRGGQTKFSQYVLPGGTDYREVLLTLPNKADKLNARRMEIEKLGKDATAEQKQEWVDIMNKIRPDNRDIEGGKRYYGMPDFRSSHWEEPNVIAHVRLNDREVNGEKVLFIEEMQSDWNRQLQESKLLREISKPNSVTELAQDVFGREFATSMPLKVTDGGMLAMLKNEEVRRNVISNIPIKVVNDLSAKKLSPDKLFSNPSMVFNVLSRDERSAVSSGIIDAMRKVGASFRTKLFSGYKAGSDINLLPALKASDLNAREIVGMLTPESVYHLDVSNLSKGIRPTSKGTKSLVGLAGMSRKSSATELTAFLNTPLSASEGASLDNIEVAGLNKKNLSASLADFLKWHNANIVKRGGSKQVYSASGAIEMPFEGNWMPLALKRILRLAAEEGYDRVAWINGEQTKLRYDLSKKIKSVVYQKTESGNRLSVVDVEGRSIYDEFISEEKIKDIIGKEPAQRLIEQEWKQGDFGETKSIEGENLKIGGEWASALYDKMIPKFYEKYGKKWGVKVEPVKLVAFKTEATGEDIVPTDHGWQIVDGRGNTVINHEFESRKTAQEWIDAHQGRSMEQQSIAITTEMRESVIYEGQPMFAKSKKGGEKKFAGTPTEEEKLIASVVYASEGKDPAENVIRIADPSEDQKALSEEVKKTTGKDVIWIDTDNTKLEQDLGYSFDGFVVKGAKVPELKNKIFISTDAEKPAQFVAYHEFAHFIQENKEYAAAFWDAVKLTPEGAELVARKGRDETMADIAGNMMSEPKFWKAIEEKGFLQKFIDKLKEILDSISKLFSGKKESEKNKAYIKNIDEVRNTLRGILREYGEEGRIGESKVSFSEREAKGQIYTPEFKKFFGDWENDPENSSKVVDADGKPMVVYRGDRPGKSVFTGMENQPIIKGNVFFTDDPSIGKFYSNQRTNYLVEPEELNEQRHGFYRTYLDIKNPFILDAKEGRWAEIPVKKRVGGKYINKIQIDDLADKVKKTGKYDGMIIKNVDDQAGIGNQYIVFSPTQIKSATGNRGTFDPENPDIRFSKREAKKRIAVEKIKDDFWRGFIPVKAGWWDSEPHWVFDFDLKAIEKKYGVDHDTAYKTTYEFTKIPGRYDERISLYHLYRGILDKSLPETGTDVTGDLLDFLKNERKKKGLSEIPEKKEKKESEYLEDIKKEQGIERIKKHAQRLLLEAGKYREKEIENHEDVVTYKNNLNKKYGFKQVIELGDFDRTYDISDVFEEQGWKKIQDRKPIETQAQYIGTFNGGEVSEMIFEKDDQKRYVYELPQRGDVDSFNYTNIVTDKKLYGDEYLELLHKATKLSSWGSKEETSEEETLPDIKNRIRESLGGNTSEPEGLGVFTPIWHILNRPDFVEITNENYGDMVDSFLENETIKIKEFNKNDKDDEGLKEFIDNKIKKWREWFDKKKTSLISAAEKIRKSIAEESKSDINYLKREHTPVEKDIARISKEVPAVSKPTVTGPLARMKAELATIRDAVTKVPKYDNFKKTLLTWDANNQRIAKSATEIYEKIKKDVPDKTRREALTIYREAAGDVDTIREWADKTTDPNLRPAYEAAMSLTEKEKQVAEWAGNLYNYFLDRGKKEGILDTGYENYVNRIIVQGERPSIYSGKLATKFKFSKKRVFPTVFEAEQAGYKVVTKDIGGLLGIYTSEFGKVLNTRELVRNLTREKAPDGRPIATTEGVGIPVGNIEEGATVIKPHFLKTEEFEGYRHIEHNALKKYKWLGTDENDNPILLEGDLAIHPKYITIMKNILGRSAIRDFYNNPELAPLVKIPQAILRGIDVAQKNVKQAMFSLSAFHWVQEGTHAIGHTVNPLKGIPTIDFDNREHYDAAMHGLRLAGDYASMDLFIEGVGTGPVMYKIPKIGPWLRAISEPLFTWYIPGLKYKTYEHIVERNKKRFSNEIEEGKVTEDDIKFLSARQANAAYGHLNYVDFGRNPTIQHLMQMFILAPDFLEARTRFAGQALSGIVSKAGREQLRAIAVLAVTLYVASRIINQMLDDDPHWEEPFSVVIGKRKYHLRSVPGDIHHLLKRPHQFISGRVSPLVGKTLQWMYTGRDYRGLPQPAIKFLEELVSAAAPISFRGLIPGASTNKDISAFDTFLNAMGIGVSRYSSATMIYEMVDKWKKKQGIEEVKGMYPPSKYRDIRNALQDDEPDRVINEFSELVEETKKPRGLLIQGLRQSLTQPFTGSQSNDYKFRQSLSDIDKAVFDNAVREKREMLIKFGEIMKEASDKDKDKDEQKTSARYPKSFNRINGLANSGRKADQIRARLKIKSLHGQQKKMYDKYIKKLQERRV